MDQQHRFRILDQQGNFGRGIGGIQRHKDRTCRQHRQIGIDEGGRIFGLHHHPVAGTHAELRKRGGILPHPLWQVAETGHGPVFPHKCGLSGMTSLTRKKDGGEIF